MLRSSTRLSTRFSFSFFTQSWEARWWISCAAGETSSFFSFYQSWIRLASPMSQLCPIQLLGYKKMYSKGCSLEFDPICTDWEDTASQPRLFHHPRRQRRPSEWVLFWELFKFLSASLQIQFGCFTSYLNSGKFRTHEMFILHKYI